MAQLKIRDNSAVNKEDFENINKVVKKIADKTLAQLEKEGVFVFPEILKDADDITKGQIILQSLNNCYRSSNVMGFLGYGNERLVIKSRFSKEKDDHFFQYLLEKVLDFPNILELNTDSNQDNQLFNLMLFLFPYYLRGALRKGIFKTYVCNRYNDKNIKGSIDVARHITYNTPFTGNVAYNQREFSYDNCLMEMVRHTIEFIKKKPYGIKLLSKVKDEVETVVAVTNQYEFFDRQKIVLENKKNTVMHAYFHEYRALQRLCLMILLQRKHAVGSGINQVHGILFDGAWLWEEYINILIGSDFYHPMNKGSKGAQRLFSTDTGKAGLVYPDFIGKCMSERVIADAKYKPIGNIGNKDYLQVLSYMFRFNSNRGYYLYPESDEGNITTYKLNSGTTFENNVLPCEGISVTKLGLQIPQNTKTYDEFKSKIYFSEQSFKAKLNIRYK